MDRCSRATRTNGLIMERISRTALLGFVLLCVAQVNGYSKYGRTCKDIGCRSTEVCVMAEDPCPLYSRNDCGRYPICKLRGDTGGLSCTTMICPSGQYCKTENGRPTCVNTDQNLVDQYPPVLDIFAENNGGELREVFRRQDAGAESESAPGAAKTSATSNAGSGYPSSSGTSSGSSGYPAGSGYPSSGSSGYPGGSGYPSSGSSGYPSSGSATRASAPSVNSGYPSYPSASAPAYPSRGGSSSYPGYPSQSGSGSGYPGYPSSSRSSGYPASSGYPSPSDDTIRRTNAGTVNSAYPSSGSSYPSGSGYPSGGSRYPSSGYPSAGSGSDDTLRRSSASTVNAGYPNSAGGYAPSGGYPSGGYPAQGQPARNNYPGQSGGYPAPGGYQGQYGQNGGAYPQPGYQQPGYQQPGYQQPGYYDQRYPNGYPPNAGGSYPPQQPKKPSITDRITDYAKTLAQRVLTQTIIDKVSGRT